MSSAAHVAFSDSQEAERDTHAFSNGAQLPGGCCGSERRVTCKVPLPLPARRLPATMVSHCCSAVSRLLPLSTACSQPRGQSGRRL